MICHQIFNSIIDANVAMIMGTASEYIRPVLIN